MPRTDFIACRARSTHPLIEPERVFCHLRLQDRDRKAISAVARLTEGLDFGRSAAASEFETDLLRRIRSEKARKPKKALEATEAAIILVKTRTLSGRATFPLLLEWASCSRRLDRIEAALECYLLVYEKALGLDVAGVTSEVLLCLPRLVARKTGDFRLALQIAEQACLATMSLGDSFQVSKSLLVRGRYLFYLGNIEAAIGNVSLALKQLPAGETSFLFAAHQNLAHFYQDQDQPLEAIHHISATIELAYDLRGQLEPEFLGGLHWTRAALAERIRESGTAEQEYLRAKNLFLQVSPVATGLVAIHFADFLVRNGCPERAKRVILSLGAVLQSLRKYPIAEAAVTQLMRFTLTHVDLTSEILRVAAKQVERECRPVTAAAFACDQKLPPIMQPASLLAHDQ